MKDHQELSNVIDIIIMEKVYVLILELISF